MNSDSHPIRTGFLALALAGLCVGPPARGGEDEAKHSNWTKVEAAGETRTYKQRLRDGGPFDDAARGFATQIALPQLGFEANRPTIERVRRRIRELLLSDIADDKAFADASTTVLEAMTALVRNRDTEPAVRVNAMLLVGELRAKDNRPLPTALPVLVATAGDVRLPLDVRIAAAAGIARHADAAKSGGEAAAVAKAVAPAVVPMLSGTPTVAGDWLAGRALALLQSLGPPAATKESLAGAARILGDGSRAVDLRIRAAAALGAAATADAGIDVGRAVESVRTAAIAGLESDALAAESRRLERRLGGEAQPSAAAAEPTIPALACLRDAWRLATCAEALVGGDGSAGLAKLLGQDGEAARQLATTLQQAAAALDANPDERSVLEALEKLGKPLVASTATGPASPPVEQPNGDTPPSGDAPSPFDAGPNASPFGP